MAEVTDPAHGGEHTSKCLRQSRPESIHAITRLRVSSNLRKLVASQLYGTGEFLAGKGITRVLRFNAFLANAKKEMEVKKTGFGARNNFLMERRTNGSALVTRCSPKRYLATNWQRPDTQAQFPSRDRRFPTPPERQNSPLLPNRRNTCRNGRTVTTKQLFRHIQRRKDVWSLRNWEPNPAKCLPPRMQQSCPPGAGSASRTQRMASTQNRSRNFWLMHALPSLHEH